MFPGFAYRDQLARSAYLELSVFTDAVLPGSEKHVTNHSLSNMKFPSKRLMSISDTQHRTVSALLYSKTAFLPMPFIAMDDGNQTHGAKRSCTAQPHSHTML